MKGEKIFQHTRLICQVVYQLQLPKDKFSCFHTFKNMLYHLHMYQFSSVFLTFHQYQGYWNRIPSVIIHRVYLPIECVDIISYQGRRG